MQCRQSIFQSFEREKERESESCNLAYFSIWLRILHLSHQIISQYIPCLLFSKLVSIWIILALLLATVLLFCFSYWIWCVPCIVAFTHAKTNLTHTHTYSRIVFLSISIFSYRIIILSTHKTYWYCLQYSHKYLSYII